MEYVKVKLECWVINTFATKTPIIAVANSGPEDPAAIKVAPAMSGGMFKTRWYKWDDFQLEPQIIVEILCSLVNEIG